MKASELIKDLTVEEKIALVSGTDFMYTNPIPRLGIKSIRMSDGPHGLRVQNKGGDNGVAGSEVATSFPTAATVASSWNPLNAYKIGEAIGEEALYYGIDIVLGPGVCIKRNPLCGRNFEYFSEDPFLSGKMGAEEVKGIQSKNVGVSVKHFALNNAENYRFIGDSVADMRSIREIYLKSFEMIVKDAKPSTIVCAYNKINGEYCSENKWLLTDVLRNEWGFDGVVISDWGATHDRVKGIKSCLDLEMPGDTDICRKWIMDALNDDSLKENDLDKAVGNVLKLINKYKDNKQIKENDWDKHHQLALDVALDSAVLLKNDGMLPLKEDKGYLVIGDLFEKMRYQGAGSSMINPKTLITPKMAFDNNNVSYHYARGYKENTYETDEVLLKEALEQVKKHDDILLFVGLTDYAESEGGDRENMSLPKNQLSLIEAILKEKKKVMVILYGGSPIELSFEKDVNAILDMYLPGEAGGEATYDILFGEKSPSGKLAETWPLDYKDVPFADKYSKTEIEVYKESVFVGYRYYLSKNKEVRYPFGYGLSYTSFEYSNMSIKENDEFYEISCDIENVGGYEGSEVVQLYVKAPQNGVFKPLKELKGFVKVPLKVGEKKKALIKVNKNDLMYWNIKENCWVLDNGEYEFQICSDCTNIKLKEIIKITNEKEYPNPYSEKVNEAYSKENILDISDDVFEEMSGLKIPQPSKHKPINLDSRFTYLQETFMGKILYNAVIGVSSKEMRKAQKLPEGSEKDNKIKGAQFLRKVLDSSSLNSMSMCGAKAFPYNFAQGFMHLANGRLFKGIKCFLSKIKAPELPKNMKENINGK